MTSPTLSPDNVHTGDSQSKSNPVPTVVGVIIAIIITVILVLVSVILVVMCIRKRNNSEWDPQNETVMEKHTTVMVDGHEGFANAVYSSKFKIMLCCSLISSPKRNTTSYQFGTAACMC